MHNGRQANPNNFVREVNREGNPYTLTQRCQPHSLQEKQCGSPHQLRSLPMGVEISNWMHGKSTMGLCKKHSGDGSLEEKRGTEVMWGGTSMGNWRDKEIKGAGHTSRSCRWVLFIACTWISTFCPVFSLKALSHFWCYGARCYALLYACVHTCF